MAAKQIVAILIIHVIVQCKELVYAVQIANVQPTFVKKLLDNCRPKIANYNLIFIF